MLSQYDVHAQVCTKLSWNCFSSAHVYSHTKLCSPCSGSPLACAELHPFDVQSWPDINVPLAISFPDFAALRACALKTLVVPYTDYGTCLFQYWSYTSICVGTSFVLVFVLIEHVCVLWILCEQYLCQYYASISISICVSICASTFVSTTCVSGIYVGGNCVRVFAKVDRRALMSRVYACCLLCSSKWVYSLLLFISSLFQTRIVAPQRSVQSP